MENTQTRGNSIVQGKIKSSHLKSETRKAFSKLETGVFAALETYSNVHRGSGYNSVVSTFLYDKARDIVLEYLGLNKRKYILIFCTHEREVAMRILLDPKDYKRLSSQDMGLPLGVRALAVKRKSLPDGAPFQTGGGTTRLISPGWVIWASTPAKFEAGTPAIVNVIAFARALLLIKQYGKEIFMNPDNEKLTAVEILYHDELEKFSGSKLLDKLRQTRIGFNNLVPTFEGSMPYINLDNSASTPTFTPVWDAVCKTWRQPGEIQKEVISEVRTICAVALGTSLIKYDVIFTSNTTEAINLVAESIRNDFEEGSEPVVLNTLLEHSSNDLPWRMIPGYSLIRLTIDDEGNLDLNELETLLIEYNLNGNHGKKRIKLVAVSGASNVLGICNDLAEISRVVHQYGACLLVDAAQLVAHRKIEMERCGIDYLAFSAHKLYAPFGTGVLMARKGQLNFSTDEMEMITSSGEENPGGIAALGKGLVLLQRIGMDLVQKEEQELTVRLLSGMRKIAGLTIYGIKDPDSPRFASKLGVIVFRMKNMMPNRVASELADRSGIGVRYGCHCAHILVKHLLNVPPWLERFQRILLKLFPRLRLPGLTRVSLGIENTKEDVDSFIRALGSIATKPVFPKDDLKIQMNNFVNEMTQKVYGKI
jgi:selenocysteine lyase/cysteine desulfurase